MADLGIYGTGFNPYDVGALGGGNLFASWQNRNRRFTQLRAQGKSIAEANRIAGTNFRPGKSGGLLGGVKKIGRNIGRAASSAARTVASGVKTIAPVALPVLQNALKLSGPLGMVASGAAGALGAVVRGEGLEGIAWAAAEGASPPGIDRALAAARALREGQPVLNVALSQARQQFAPGPAQRAFDLGVAAAKGGTKGALNSARQQLRSAAEKAAFDSAIGSIAKAAPGLPAHPITRPDPIGLASRVRRQLSGYRHPSTELALAALRRQPALRRLSLGDLSRRLNLPARHVADARGLLEDTGAAGDELGSYTLRSGDTGSGLAKRFTGDANRWRELPAVNKRGLGRYTGSKDMVVKQVRDKTGKITTTLLDPFYSGLVINVPPGWTGPGVVAGTPPVTTVPEVIVTPSPAPTPAPSPIPGVPVSVPPTIPTPPTSVPSPIPGQPPIALPPVTPTVPPIPPAVPGSGAPPIEPPKPDSPIPGLPSGVPVPKVPAAAKKKEDGAGIALGLASLGLLLM